MNQRFWILIVPLCLACAACGEATDTTAPGTTGPGATGPVVHPASQQPNSATAAAGAPVDAAEFLSAQSALREEFDGWQRDAADQSKPIPDRQAAVQALADHALHVSGVEQKPWGTVRHQLIDQESATALRQLAVTGDEAEIRMQAIKTLGQLKDIDGMDVLIAGLEDESLEVRQAAIDSVRNIMSTDFGFRADASPGERAEAVAKSRKFWDVCLANARFVEGVRNPAMLQKWKKAAKWREPTAEDFRIRN